MVPKYLSSSSFGISNTSLLNGCTVTSVHYYYCVVEHSTLLGNENKLDENNWWWSYLFKCPKQLNSQGFISGEYGGWGRWTQWRTLNNSRTGSALCELTLSCGTWNYWSGYMMFLRSFVPLAEGFIELIIQGDVLLKGLPESDSADINTESQEDVTLVQLGAREWSNWWLNGVDDWISWMRPN